METLKFLTSLVLTFSLLGGVCSAEVLQKEEDRETYREQYIMDSVWGQMTEEQQYNAEIKYKANAVRLSVEDFELFARVVEAESDGKGWDGYTNEGRIYVACCIWDRVYDEGFPNTVREVLTQSGQFTTVSGGKCRKNSTLASEWAIIVGRFALASGEVPTNMLYFNCIGYFRGFSAFAKVGDNYFSTTGEPTYATDEDLEYAVESVFYITRGDELDE